MKLADNLAKAVGGEMSSAELLQMTFERACWRSMVANVKGGRQEKFLTGGRRGMWGIGRPKIVRGQDGVDTCLRIIFTLELAGMVRCVMPHEELLTGGRTRRRALWLRINKKTSKLNIFAANRQRFMKFRMNAINV